MTQIKQINKLCEDLEEFTDRTRVVNQAPWCDELDVETIWRSHLSDIKMALNRAKLEALTYGLRPRTWSECWSDLIGRPHLPEHKKCSRLLARLKSAVDVLEREFSPGRQQYMSADYAICIVHELKAKLEKDTTLPQSVAYAGLVP